MHLRADQVGSLDRFAGNVKGKLRSGRKIIVHSWSGTAK